MNKTSLIKPIFSECENCIVLSLNDAYVPLASVTIKSIVDNSQTGNKYDIIILHSGLSQFLQVAINGLIDRDNISVRFCDVSQYVKGRHFFVKNREGFNEEAYYRILIPWLLDESYKYALYIDGDMVVLKDINDIFDHDLTKGKHGEGYLIGAVRDYWGIWNCYKPGETRRSYRESISLTNIDDYVISSTIIFNLNLFREKYTINQVLDLSSSREWLQHDQDVINVLCKDSITLIDASWGLLLDYGKIQYLPEYMVTELMQARIDPAIVHFAAKRKPWLLPYMDHFLDFWRYALETPFFQQLFNKIESNEYKNYVAYTLSKEGRGRLDCSYVEDDVIRYFKGCSLGSIKSGHTKYRSIAIDGNTLSLEGMVAFFGVSQESTIKISFFINGKELEVTHQEREDGFNLERRIYTYRGESFNFTYKLDKSTASYNVKMLCYLNGLPLEKTNLGFEEHCPLSRRYKHAYCKFGDWVVTTDKKTISITEVDRRMSRLSYEILFLKELLLTKKKSNIKAIFVRTYANLLRPFIKKQIWLIYDELMCAGGEGETFFRQVCQRSEVYAYFVISRESVDFKRLKQYGKVIGANSIRHKVLTLLATVILYSQPDETFINPFGRRSDVYKDFFSQQKFVSLQHGCELGDISHNF